MSAAPCCAANYEEQWLPRPSQESRPTEQAQSHLRRLLYRLGYEGDPGFVTPGDLNLVKHQRHVFQSAFENIGVCGVFCVRSPLGSGGEKLSPIVYVVATSGIDEADEIHRLVWSQGVVPLVLLAMPEGIQIRSGLAFVRRGAETIPWARTEAEDAARDLAGIRASSLRTSLAWRDFEPKPDSRIDSRLLSGITKLNEFIRQRHAPLREHPDLINAMIGRLLYLFVLFDRGILDQAWIGALQTSDGRPACPDLNLGTGGGASGAAHAVWPADQVWALFDGIDAVLNGSIFPISLMDRTLLSADVVHLMRRVLRYDDVLTGGQQFGFLDVKFASVRTETISAMYELFFLLQNANAKKTQGAFYTPPYLVDYVLDELDDIRPLDGHSVVCDPAAGSGTFLVGAYRRIIERELRGTADGRLADLSALLLRCIHGVEMDPQAASVARFSLYLTMLDYVRGATLTEVAAKLGGEPLFPPLDANIAAQDFFEGALPQPIARSVTHLIGNPPWTKVQPGTAADRYRHSLPEPQFPVSHNRISELFVWRGLNDALKPGGAFAMLLPTKSFVSSSATRFPFRLAEHVRLHGLTNFWHFRYRLFTHARNHAIAVFGSSDRPCPLDRVWVYSPLLTTQPIGVSGWPWAVLVDRGSVDYLNIRDLLSPDRAWFWNLMLQPLDRTYARLLLERSCPQRRGSQTGTTLGAFLDTSGMMIGRGGSAKDTRLASELLLGTDPKKESYYRRALGLAPGLEPTYTLPVEELERVPGSFRHMFGGYALLITRNHLYHDVLVEPVAFGTSIHAIAFTENKFGQDKKVLILRSLEHYLRSSLARYLFALVGRSWLLDGRRFENNDMRDLPVPFLSADDLLSRPIIDMSDNELIGLFISAFRLDLGFSEAVQEFVDFREGYQDAQVPRASFNPPSDQHRRSYIRAFKRHLDASFGTRAAVEVDQTDRGAEFGLRSLEVLLAPTRETDRMDAPKEDPEGAPVSVEYIATAKIVVDVGSARVTIAKPFTRAAWTMDRAYADAQHVVNELLLA